MPIPYFMEESTLESYLVDQIKKLGGMARKLVTPGYTGIPDRLVLLPAGRIIFVELKAKGKKPNARQTVVIRLLRKMGFEVWWIDTKELLKEFIIHCKDEI